MVRKQDEYDLALTLRQRGLTLAEIAKLCGTSKSTISKWLKNKDFSHDITARNSQRAARENAKRLRLMAKVRGAVQLKQEKDIAQAAKVEFENYQSLPEFRSGLMIFVVGGNRTAVHRIQLSHSEVDMHRQFHAFTERFLGVEREKIKLQIHYANGLDWSVVLQHWQRHTKLPQSQFFKPQSTTQRTAAPLRFGVGNTIIASTYHRKKLLEWVEMAQKRW